MPSPLRRSTASFSRGGLKLAVRRGCFLPEAHRTNTGEVSGRNLNGPTDIRILLTGVKSFHMTLNVISTISIEESVSEVLLSPKMYQTSSECRDGFIGLNVVPRMVDRDFIQTR